MIEIVFLISLPKYRFEIKINWSINLLILSYPSVLAYVLGAQKNISEDGSFEYPQHMIGPEKPLSRGLS